MFLPFPYDLAFFTGIALAGWCIITLFILFPRN